MNERDWDDENFLWGEVSVEFDISEHYPDAEQAIQCLTLKFSRFAGNDHELTFIHSVVRNNSGYRNQMKLKEWFVKEDFENVS